MEDKTSFVKAFSDLIKQTRSGSDIDSMEYEKTEHAEYVKIKYLNGHIRRIEITADSCCAIITDVIKHMD